MADRSFKYAYMCHFFANPLSIFLSEDHDRVRKLLQPEHLEAIRTLGSFRGSVEAAVEAGLLSHARSLLEDDQYLIDEVLKQLKATHNETIRRLQSLRLMMQIARLGSFIELYMTALDEGIDPQTNAFSVVEAIRRRRPDEVVKLCNSLANEIGKNPQNRDRRRVPTGAAASCERATRCCS